MKKNFSTVVFLLMFVLLIAGPLSPKESPIFEQPVLITSAGQSADIQLASVLAKRAGLNFALSKTATSQALTDVKTLAVVIGTSLKGLGAAGLDMSQENERVLSLIKSAQQHNIPILCLHLGGEQRRGTLSDQMIKTVLPYAQSVIVVKSGNKDGLFTEICLTHSIPLIEVEKTTDVLEPLKNSFF
jgi:hypothetical protein